MGIDLLRKIEELRTRPVHVRNRYAFWIAFFATLVVLGLWSTTLPARFQSPAVSNIEQQQPETNSVLSSFGSLFASVRDNFLSVQDQINENRLQADPNATTTQDNQLDFEAMIASSSARRSGFAATTTASSTTATSSATSSSLSL